MISIKKALVTGGAGFIGSHLVDLLLSSNIPVTVLDNFCNGREKNLQHHQSHSKLNIVKADIRDYQSIAPLFKDCQWVFHLAALADIVPSINNPEDYFTTNVDGTFNVLQAAKKAGVKRFLYAASSSCYGIPDTYPTNEEATIQPQYPYALTKFIGETMVLHWGQVYKLPVVSLRLFNVYGTRSRTTGTYGAVFGVFLAQKLAGKPFTVVGDGKQTRDFTYVTDIAKAFFLGAKSDITNEIFNVGSGNTYSVNRLVKLLSGESIHIPKRPGEPDCTFADIQKIRNKLNFQPEVDFEEGVKRLLDNIDYWKDAPVWNQESIGKATADWFKHLSN